MDIKTYIKKNKLTQDDFGKLVGVTQALVSRWYNDPLTVSPQKAKQIEERTKGALTRKGLRPYLFA